MAGDGDSEAGGGIEALLESLSKIAKEASSAGDPLGLLRELSGLKEKYASVIEDYPDVEDYIGELEYTLAYNALASGAPPATVKKLVGDKAWGKLQPELFNIAVYLLYKNAIQARNPGEARKILSEYRPYLTSTQADTLKVAASPEAVDILSCLYSCNNNELLERAQDLVREYKAMLDRYGPDAVKYVKLAYGVDLAGAIDTLARALALRLLEENAGNPGKALEEIEKLGLPEVSGSVASILGDIEHYEAAVRDARNGRVDAALSELAKIKDKDVLAPAVSAVLSILYNEHPDLLAKLTSTQAARLQGLVDAAGLEVDVKCLVGLAQTAVTAEKLADAISKHDYEEAEKIWSTLSEDEKAIVATLLGFKPDEVDELLSVLKLAGEAEDLLEEVYALVRKGDFQGAYNAWVKASRKVAEYAAKMAGYTYDSMKRYLGILAAVAATLSRKEPTLDDLKSELAKRLGGDEAERLVDEIMKSDKYMPPLAKFKILADSGDYDEAVSLLGEIGDKHKAAAVQYLLYEIVERDGPEAAVKFFAGHRELLKYLPDNVRETIEAYMGASEASKVIAGAVEQAASEGLADRLNSVLAEVESYLKSRDVEKAEEVIVKNRELLLKSPELSKILDYMSLIDAYNALDDISAAIDTLLKEASGMNNEKAREMRGEAENLVSRIDSYIEQLKQLAEKGVKQAAEYLEAFKKAKARALLLEALADAALGDARAAAEHAREAAGLDGELADMAAPLIALASDNPIDDIKCVLETLGIHHGPGGAAHHGGVPTPKPE